MRDCKRAFSSEQIFSHLPAALVQFHTRRGREWRETTAMVQRGSKYLSTQMSEIQSTIDHKNFPFESGCMFKEACLNNQLPTPQLHRRIQYCFHDPLKRFPFQVCYHVPVSICRHNHVSYSKVVLWCGCQDRLSGKRCNPIIFAQNTKIYMNLLTCLLTNCLHQNGM